MRLAFVSDIHGNLAALDAVIADMSHRKIQCVVNLGDSLSGPLLPLEIAARLQNFPWLHVAGNHEREELQAYAAQAKCIDRSYPFLASQKSIKTGFSANSLAQTFALLYESAGLQGASSHSGRRTFLTSLANKGTAIHILKTLAGHRSISTTAAYLYSSPSQLKAAVEFALKNNDSLHGI